MTQDVFASQRGRAHRAMPACGSDRLHLTAAGPTFYVLISQSARNETHGYTGSFVSMLGTARPSTCKTHAASNGGFQSCSFDILQSSHLIVIGRLGALRGLPVCGSATRRNQQTCRSRRERLHNLWRRRAGLLRTMLSRSSRRLQPTCLSVFFF